MSSNPLSAVEPWDLVAGQYNLTSAHFISTFLKSQFVTSSWNGSAPLVMMRKAMGEELWREKEKLALAWLEKALAGKPEELTSDAWLGVGVK